MQVPFEQNVGRATIEDLIDPFVVNKRYDLCPFCKARRVELYSFNNYPQNYSEAVDAYLQGYDVSFNKCEIRMMKCKSCQKEFVIDWTSGFPVPLKDTYRTDRFFAEFSEGY